ncbi:MAG: hypothetical protein WCT41_03240 [Candidatus Paceibacterota bacterium]|jgi:hypothetical protein
MYADTSKMKILGVECWCITMPDTIQPREYSKSGGMDGALHIIATLTATCMSATSTGTTTGGTGTTTGSTMTGMTTTLLRCAQLSSSLTPLLRGRVLLRQLPIPAAEHLADFFKWNRKCGIFLRIKRSGFPEYEQQDF